MIKVLIIDDEPGVRARLRSIIDWEAYGYEIVGDASDGEEGLIAAMNFRPELIITDIRMPVLSGLELAKQVKTVMPETNIVILSGYSDFQFAHEAIKYGVKDYLLKPVDEDELIKLLENIRTDIETLVSMNKRLKQADDVLVKELLLDLINNRSKLTRLQLSGFLKFDCEKMCYTVVILEIDDFEKILLKQGEKAAFSIRDKIREKLDKLVDDRNRVIILEKKLQSFTLLYISAGEIDGTNRFKQWVMDLKQELLPVVENITVGIGTTIQDITNIYRSYIEASECIESRLLLGKNQIISYGDVSEIKMSKEWGFVLNFDRNHLLEAVENNESIEISIEVEKLFKILSEKKLAPNFINSIIIENIIGIIRLITFKKGDIFQVVDPKVDLEKHIKSNKSIPELLEWFMDFCLKASDYINKLDKHRPKKVTDRVIEIINSSYDKDITLKGIAALVYMSPVYLGHLFKNDTGKSFNDYLTEVRIKKAVKLLRETDMPIYEIAESIGYSAAGNFYAAFKKVKKCNPMDYRMHKVEEKYLI